MLHRRTCTVINLATIQDNITCVRYHFCLIWYSKLKSGENSFKRHHLRCNSAIATGFQPFYCSTPQSDVHSTSNNNASMSIVWLNQTLRHQSTERTFILTINLKNGRRERLDLFSWCSWCVMGTYGFYETCTPHLATRNLCILYLLESEPLISTVLNGMNIWLPYLLIWNSTWGCISFVVGFSVRIG